MTKRTILKLVQELGEGISSDEIDELGETVEVETILTILKQTVDEVLSRKRWEFLKDKVRQLDDRADGSTQLNTLNIPDDVTRITCLQYRDTNSERVKFTKIMYMQPCDFITYVQARNSTDTNVLPIINDDGVAVNTLTDSAPTRWTSFDEVVITFDAYDESEGEGNLIADSVIIADVIPVTDYTDPTAVLNIPERMESLIFNEALSTCNYRLRQTRDPKADRVSLRQHRAMREQENVIAKDVNTVNFGRRSRSGR